MRGMFRNWNMILVVLTFNLTIFGTFLTRSNILQSVHTFGDTGLTPFFMTFLFVTVVGPFILIAKRHRDFDSEDVLESWMSREGGFLISSALFLVAGLGVLLGTIFPLFVQTFTGATVNITASFFNQVDVPLFVIIVGIMGICPFLVFRRSPLKQVGRSLMVPFGLGVGLAVTLGAIGVGPWYVAVTFGVCLFVLAAMVTAWARGLIARRAGKKENPFLAFGRLVWSNRLRYGGYIVHLGMVLMTVGVIGSTAFKVEQDASLKLGESMTVGGYRLTYDDLRSSVSGQKDIVTAKVSVYRGDQYIDMLFPEKLLHRNYEQPVTEVAVRSTPVEDLYIILSGWDDNKVASFKVFINPLVLWLWIGGGLLLLGGLIALWPGRRLTGSGEGQEE
jgi:cytochrome c-type biogenesis protein CcmF